MISANDRIFLNFFDKTKNKHVGKCKIKLPDSLDIEDFKALTAKANDDADGRSRSNVRSENDAGNFEKNKGFRRTALKLINFTNYKVCLDN